MRTPTPRELWALPELALLPVALATIDVSPLQTAPVQPRAATLHRGRGTFDAAATGPCRPA